ncbi:MAG TPA: BrnT family toxin [Pseudorhizobium sp.]|nr:BrnT family toxin [Pseudorhizobium sp.]
METERFVAFEWDEAKRSANIEKHGIDFFAASAALLRPHAEIRSDRNGEVRLLAVCPAASGLITVIYTMRGESCRIISARAAHINEQRTYRQIFGG